jgi:hypothetical protein
LAARARAPHEAERHWGAPMSGCWLKSASNTREATTYSQWVAVGCKRFAWGCNTREATTYNQWAAVGCKSKSTTWGRETLRRTNERLLAEVSKQHQRGNNLQPMNGCWLQALCLRLQHQRGNNLQPMSGCWLQEQEHHMRQRDIEAPMKGC